MLFQDIPQNFKNTMNTYWYNMLSNVKKKNNVLSLNKVQYPANIKTDHYQLDIGCEKHLEIMTELLFLLQLFHQFAEKHKILYSISSGNLLGHLSNCDIFPWDDDMDIIIATKHFKIIEDLWNNSGESKQIWDIYWEYKSICLDSYPIILLKCKGVDLFKIKLNIENISKTQEYQKDIGGIDICTINWTALGGRSKSFPQGLVNFIIKNEEEKFYPIINYGIIETRGLKKELARVLLDSMYPRWREMKHPNLLNNPTRLYR